MKDILNGEKTSFIERRYIRFGKFVLNHYKLNENILLIKYFKSHAPVPKLKSTKISNDFKILLRDLLDTERINIVVQKKLSKIESNTFELLIKLAGIAEQLNYERQEPSIEDYTHRFQILQGEIGAGNDSTILKNEIIEIIGILNKASKINDNDAKELINILK